MADDSGEKMSLSFDTEALDLWAAFAGSNAERIVRLHINLALKNSAGIVQRQEYKEAPRGVTGGTIKSIRQIVSESMAIVGPTSKYAIFINNGTKPHMPPVDELKEWADSKGMNPWALAMSIKKKGTKANPFVPRTFSKTRPDVIAEFALATSLITVSLAKKGLTI
jgi:hypothetical protein